MRGKYVVIAMLLGALALFLYSLWFVSTTSPVDQRFNVRREPLGDDTPGALILRQRAGDYLRQELLVDTLDSLSGSRHGSAEYLVDGRLVRLEVQDYPEGPPSLDALFADFGARAGGNDAAGTAIRLYPEAQIPYGYGVYSAPTYIYYEFTWINGNWVLRASTREAGSEALLRFANGYVY